MVMTTETLTPEQSAWSSKDVCKALGITYRQLDLWIRSGVMAPSVARAQGYGTSRQFSFTDLVHIELIHQLLDSHVPLQSIKKALRHLREHRLSVEELEQAYLVTNGKAYFVLYYSDHELSKALKEAMQRRRPILSVALGNVIATVRIALGLEPKLNRRQRKTEHHVVDQVAEAVAMQLRQRRNGNLDSNRLLNMALQRTGAEYGEVFLLDRSRGKLVLQTFTGIDDEPLQDETEYQIGKGLPGLAAQTGESIIRTYLAGEPRFMKRAQLKGLRFFACVPLKVGNIVIGTIHVGSMHPTLPPEGSNLDRRHPKWR